MSPTGTRHPWIRRLTLWMEVRIVRRPLTKLTLKSPIRETVGMQIVSASMVLDVVVLDQRVAH
ncbi:hypothetical protein SA2016_2441 [Sinomonas atrocyanea]|uniref:Uncharacterized protein n=1 Tax=Sinomonas atrocyanea TaxID=37927 RepID=A0A127A0Z7_9MICC|nr:hypothetical protein SA2016_2441 [Sinomonas atrocyanea]